MLINKNGSRILLNANQVVLAYDEDIYLTSNSRVGRYKILPAEQEVLYTIQLMLAGGRGYELMYDSKEERDAVLDQLLQIISPAQMLDSPAGLPITWSEFGRQQFEQQPSDDVRIYTRSEVFLTREEFDSAVQARVQLVLEEAKEIPIPKPPRKPYTRKPRE